MNWFVYDSAGNRYGPFTNEQLKQLAVSGRITHNTVVEASTGSRGLAGQLSGLFPVVGEGRGARSSQSNTAVNASNPTACSDQRGVSDKQVPTSNWHMDNHGHLVNFALGKHAKPRDIKLINNLFIIYMIVWFVSIFINKFYSNNTVVTKTFAFGGGFILICLLYRMWCPIPESCTRLSPVMATILLFIPFFGVFLNLYGLSNALNRSFRRYRLKYTVPTWLVVFPCIVSSVYYMLSVMSYVFSCMHLFALRSFSCHIFRMMTTFIVLLLPFWLITWTILKGRVMLLIKSAYDCRVTN